LPFWLSILFSVFNLLPWGKLIELFIPLITKREEEIKAGDIDGDQAREMNIGIGLEETSSSKAIPEFVLRIAHELAFAYVVYNIWGTDKVKDFNACTLFIQPNQYSFYFIGFFLTSLKYQSIRLSTNCSQFKAVLR